MKKPDKRDTVNLFFSAFLIIAFIICAHFFTQFTATLSPTVASIISILIFVVFGLLLFYATRVGDGKAVKRFSLVTLIVMVLPPLYIIIASLAPGMLFYDTFSSPDGGINVIVSLAGVVLGYGIPYTFLSGFELQEDNAVVENSKENVVLEGGVEADVISAEAEESEEADTQDSAQETEADEEPEKETEE